MNKPKSAPVRGLPLATTLYFFFPLAVCWLVISLASTYMAYYGIGINPAANNGFLVYFVGPILLLGLLIAATAFWHLGKHFIAPPWRRMALGALLVFALGMGAFFLFAQYFSGYPTKRQQDMGEFLFDYLRKPLGQLLHRH